MSASPPAHHPPEKRVPRPSRGRLLRRRFRGVLRRIIRSDHILITVIAVSMTLSVFAVYQATRASDDGEYLLDQARIVETQVSRQTGYLRTLVDHDVDVLRPTCQAALERDIARDSYFDQQPRVDDLVAAQLTLDALGPLLLGDRTASCAATDGSEPRYVVQRAQQRLESFLRTQVPGAALPTLADASELESRADRTNTSERFLMGAGFLFALVVAGAIAIDQLGARRVRPQRLSSQAARRMQHGILAISTPMFLVALAVLARHSVDPSHTAAVVAGLAAIVAVQWAWLRRMRGRTQRPAKGGRWRWWAEITGAFTLVAFTAAAVGLSLATIQEREANARGDRQDAVAFHLQQIGQQQALRDLEGLSLIASLDAEEVTARQLSAISAGAGVSGEDLFLAEEYANEAEAIAAMTDEIDDRIRGTDQDLRDQLRSGVAAAESQECDIASADPARTSRELFTELELEPDVVMAHVLSHQGPALSCDIVAALSRSEARGWSDRASTLTVTLVVLGLAGFLLALAASSERSARSSRTLFVLGAAGTASALIIGLVPATALLTGPREPRGDSARDFGRDVGNVVSDPCGGDEGLDAAIATYGSFGPAFQARAYATNCGSAIHEWPAVSSHVDPARVPEIVSDLEQALIHGPDTPQLRGDLGWFLILSGIHEREPRDIQGGLASTTRAINQLEDDASGAGGAIHILRFNRALALAALDDPSSALEAYRTAVRCLRPDEQCQGGGLVDRNLEESIRFGALGDLELVGGGMDLDDYRFEIVGSTRGDASTPPVGEGGIDVFPQELQVSVAVNDGADSQASIVWYYRPDDRASWAVLPGPSASTWRVGPHLNTPVPTRTLLPSGQYRADVYSAGRRVELLTEHEADSDMVRHASRRLGLSVVVPSEWTEWRDDGVEWHIGPTAKSGVTLRRTEAAAPAEIVPYLITQLLNWPATRADPELTPADDDWFLGLDDTVVGRTAEDGRVMAAAGLAPYASHWGCGGTLFLARVTSDPASPPPERIYESIVLERQADALPQNPGTLEAEGVRVQVPWYWDAAPRPEGSTNSLMSAKDCTGDANLIVSSRPIAQPLSDYVADLVETYRLGFPEFKLESQSQEPVDGANDAMRLRLTWQPQHLDEPIRQWVVFAVKDDHVIRATVSTNVRDSDYYREDIDLMMSSFALVG